MTPPKNRRMVGALRSSPRGQLAPGDAVEVRQLARGSRGSWRPAIVKQVLNEPLLPNPSPTSDLDPVRDPGRVQAAWTAQTTLAASP